jgi:hypothetical protein
MPAVEDQDLVTAVISIGHPLRGSLQTEGDLRLFEYVSTTQVGHMSCPFHSILNTIIRMGPTPSAPNS